MKNRVIKAAFAAMLNQASLLCAGLFAVIANSFRCSAFRFRCSGITAKTQGKTLIEKENISNKSPENGVEKFSFPVLSLFGLDNREKAALRVAPRCHSKDGRALPLLEELVLAKARRRKDRGRTEALNDNTRHSRGNGGKASPPAQHLRAFARTSSRASEARPGQRYSWRGRPGQAGRGKIRLLRRPAPLPALPRAHPRATP